MQVAVITQAAVGGMQEVQQRPVVKDASSFFISKIMKYTTITNGIADYVLRVDPYSVLNAGYASNFVECPDDVEPGWVIADGVWTAPSTKADPGRELAEFLAYVDAQVDAIYIAVQGERITEYMLAESEATAYKTAGYKGTVPGSAASWAAAKGKDARWACDDILTTAASWRYMQNMLRSQRLGIKEQAKTSPSLAPLRTQFDGFVVGVKQKLGIA